MPDTLQLETNNSLVSLSDTPPSPPLNPELRETLLQYEKLKEIYALRKKERGIDFYVPNAFQHRAHQSKARIIVIQKGNRAGGSTFGILEICFALTKRYPVWFSVERRFTKPIKIRIITDKFFKMDTVIEPKLREYLPKKEFVRIRRSPQGYLTKIITKDGSFIEFLTGEQDLMAFEGQDLDLLWIDEPIDRRKFIASQRGLIDRGGLTILTFTPLVEPWMKEEIVDKADGKLIDVFYGDTRDNLFDIEGNSILKEEDVKQFEGLLTEDEKETRIHGKFFHLRGIVYKEFNPLVHCIDSFDYDKDFANHPVICVLDPHDRLPHHLIWAVIDRTNDIYIMYEIIREGTITELAASIKATETYFAWNISKRLIDPNFGKKPLLSTGLSVIQELAKFKVQFMEADDNIEAGHLKVKEYLHYNKNKSLDINNRPKLYFVKDKVPKTIRSIMNYQYDEWKSKTDRDPKEDTKPKDNHGADCLRYLCMSQPSFYLPRIYESQEAVY